MKYRFEEYLMVSLFLAAVWGLTGCYHYSTSTLQGKTTFIDEVDHSAMSASQVRDTSDVRSYEFFGVNSKGEACTTYHRVYESKEELCMGLQHAPWNADCALDKRQEKFKQSCSGMVWGQGFMENLLAPTQEGRITCFTGHKGKDDTISQGTAHAQLLLVQTDFVALVRKKLNKENFATHLELHLEVQSKGGITEVRKAGSWKLDSLAHSEPIQVFSRSKNAILVCFPGIHSQLPAGIMPR